MLVLRCAPKLRLLPVAACARLASDECRGCRELRTQFAEEQPEGGWPPNCKSAQENSQACQRARDQGSLRPTFWLGVLGRGIRGASSRRFTASSFHGPASRPRLPLLARQRWLPADDSRPGSLLADRATHCRERVLAGALIACAICLARTCHARRNGCRQLLGNYPKLAFRLSD